MSTPARIDRSQAPVAGPLHVFRFPAFRHHRLACGADAYVARVARYPLVSVEFLFPAGSDHNPLPAPGLASMTGALMDEGTARRSSMEIATSIEHLGGQLGTGADWDAGYIAAGVLSGDLDAALELMTEIALEVAFPEAEVERIRRLRLTEILRRAAMPNALADDRLLQVLYAGTAYGTPLIGSEPAIRGLLRQDLVAFYQTHYRLANAAVVAVGDLDPDALLTRLDTLFAGAERSAPAPVAPPITVETLPGIVIHLVDRPGAAQTELRLGHVGIARSHPDHTAVAVLNTLLGGKFTSRINLNLRERHGYCYGASSHFASRLGPGPFIVSTAVETGVAGAAAVEVLAELTRIREDLVTTAELDDTRNYLLGVFPYTLQTVDDLASRLEDLAVYSLPDEHYDRLPERVAAVGRDDLRTVAGRHLHPEAIAIVAVGPVAELRAQFEGLGSLTVHQATLPEAVPGAGDR
jgi:zinc protease